MNAKTPLPVSSQTQTAVPLEVVPVIPWKEIVPLSRVLSGITRDSRTEPKTYLDETVVPHGGE
jgi:hypothetical protein